MINELNYRDVWKTLSSIECKNVDKKGKFTYMSWGVCWLELMKVYPFASYEFLPESYENNGTVMCNCIVRIGNLERSMFLPVMDFKNNSVGNPTSREISDTRMRCLVKCIAMFGLGHHIFSNKDSAVYGEDLPDAKKDAGERTVVEKSSVNETDDYLDAWNEPVTAFTFVKTSGEVIHVDSVSKYIKGLDNNLSDPSNVLHKKLYSKNKDNILAVLESTTKGTENHTKLENMIGLYEDK